MSVNPTLPRAQVHRLSELCAEGPAVEAAARRALESQPRLVKFFKANLPQMASQPGEVSLYLLSVVIRVFGGSGGKLNKSSTAEIEAATRKIQAHARGLLPGDDFFPDRVRTVSDRAQPHLLEEALHALFERQKNLDKEVDISPQQAALIFVMLWASVEALNLTWRAGETGSWLQEDPEPASPPAGAPEAAGQPEAP